MAALDYIFTDAGLTTNFDPAIHTLGAFAENGGAGDGVFYIGHPTLTLRAETDPGIDPITISIADSAPGSNVEATHIKLALSQVGLDSATGGASLNAGTVINPGAVNAVPVWYRWDNSIGSGVYTEISLEVVALAAAA